MNTYKSLICQELDKVKSFCLLNDTELCNTYLSEKDEHFAAPRSKLWVSDLQQLQQSDFSESALNTSIQNLKTWRKGPFNLNKNNIDAEWRSNLKWDRLTSIHSLLTDKTVLDVGGGNGYFLFEMAKANVTFALNIDPTIQFFMQYQLAQQFYKVKQVAQLPLGWQHLDGLNGFDWVFCMGVLYHCPEPVKLLKQLKNQCTDSVVLETLIDSSDKGFKPNRKRYACMRHIYEVPSIDQLKQWVKEAGFSDCETIHVGPTTSLEQRQTDLTGPFSFIDTLDPKDSSKTVEGYPAPVRAMLRLFC